MSPGIDTGSSANNDWYDVYPDGRLIHRKTGKHIMTAALPVTNLLDPPCAEVTPYGAIGCGRCHALPGQDCLDTAARAAQEAVRTLGGSQVAITCPEAPTELPGGVAEALGLPWSTSPRRPSDVYTLVRQPDGVVAARASSSDRARYIVLAANHHAALVEALEACIKPWAFQSDDQLEGIIKHASHNEIRAKLQATLSARALLERIRAGGGG